MSLFWWVRHIFVPHHSNNHRARILHPAALSLLVALFLICQFVLNFYLLLSPSVLGFASSITPEKVVEVTNQKRAEQGLAPLTLNNKLNEAAQRKAGDMFAFNYWSHSSPSGRTPWQFFQEVGYKYLYAGENLARDFMNSESVVDAWMNSPTHQDNILNSNYKETGLAVVNGTLGGVETTLVVQLFGTPTPAPVASRKPEITLSNPAPRLGEASVAPTSAAALVQAKREASALPLLSPFWLTKTLAVFLLGIILGALALDVILVHQKKIVRLSGRNLAHLIFVGALLLSVVLTTQGAIL